MLPLKDTAHHVKERNETKRESAVRQPGSLLRTPERIASIVLLWSLGICHSLSLVLMPQTTAWVCGVFRIPLCSSLA